jgi:hypothetical protein
VSCSPLALQGPSSAKVTRGMSSTVCPRAMSRRCSRARRLAVCLTMLASLLALAPAPVAPQAIAGVVVDDRTLEPVPGALVRLVIQGWLDRATETDSIGRFFLSTPREDQYQLEVSRMGYQTTRSQRVLVAAGDTVSVEFRVLPDAILMDPIMVTGYTRRGRNAFDRRRQEWGRGLFLTPAQIDSIAPEHPAHALEGLEKVHVQWGWGPTPSGGSGPMPSVRGLLGRGCLLYMVDFVPVRPEPFAPGIWSGYQLGSLLGKDIVAVEVYRSVSEVPPELYRFSNQVRTIFSEGGPGVRYQYFFNCGLVVFWTRAGW